MTKVQGGDEPRGSGRKKKLLSGIVLAVVVAAAAYWFVLRPTSELPPEPGEALVLESIQVNLAQGHYLRVAVVLQLSTEVSEEVDGSKALDATIELYSGRPVAQMLDKARRAELKAELGARVAELYPDEVLGIYFAEFVTQ
ncbi:flagellar basal body-associated FliL family protein [Nocardioides psychrotolerans]|uniref:flagellar basal body-associated FliL family protein n=1 Tax=Nocardioides psychrotolerans TaxID=1005945 RepID=UPI0031381CAA